MSGDQMIFAGLGALFIVLGLPLAQRRVRPNAWYGLRIPATFADEQVWHEANALGGRDLIAVGVGLIVLAFGLPHVLPFPPEGYVYAYTAALLVGTLGSVIRAWRMANRLGRERRGRATGGAGRAGHPTLSRSLFIVGSLLLGGAPSLTAQRIAVDSESAVARFALRPVESDSVHHGLRISGDSVARPRRSRAAAAGLGFLAGAAAGLGIAHIVNETQRHGEGKLENYFGIPLGLGMFTAATIFVAMGD